MCVFLFLCITSLLLDIRLVLAYLPFLMSSHNKFEKKLNGKLIVSPDLFCRTSNRFEI